MLGLTIDHIFESLEALEALGCGLLLLGGGDNQSAPMDLQRMLEP